MPTKLMNIASTMISTGSVATAVTQASVVAPFTGLRSIVRFPVARESNADFSSLPSNGGRVQCMQVWPPTRKKKFETLSYLRPLNRELLAKEIKYLLRMGWIPCLEFESKNRSVYHENYKSPGYCDGRCRTLWKLLMFGCTEAVQVLNELDEAIKAYPNAFIRIIGFDNVRQCNALVSLPTGPLISKQISLRIVSYIEVQHCHTKYI